MLPYAKPAGVSVTGADADMSPLADRLAASLAVRPGHTSRRVRWALLLRRAGPRRTNGAAAVPTQR